MRKILCLILAITVALTTVSAFTGDEEFPYRPWWCDDCHHYEICSHPAPYMRGDLNGDGKICYRDAYLVISLMLNRNLEYEQGCLNIDTAAAWRAAYAIHPSNWNVDPSIRTLYSREALEILKAMFRLPSVFGAPALTSMVIPSFDECGCCVQCECSKRSDSTQFVFEWIYCDCESGSDCPFEKNKAHMDRCLKQLCGYYTRPGQILSVDGPITTADAFEILKFVVGLPSVIDTDERAARAAIVFRRYYENSRAGAVPNMNDALEILKHIVGLPTAIDEYKW